MQHGYADVAVTILVMHVGVVRHRLQELEVWRLHRVVGVEPHLGFEARSFEFAHVVVDEILKSVPAAEKAHAPHGQVALAHWERLEAVAGQDNGRVVSPFGLPPDYVPPLPLQPEGGLIGSGVSAVAPTAELLREPHLFLQAETSARVIRRQANETKHEFSTFPAPRGRCC